MDQIPNKETMAEIPKKKFEAWKDDPEAVLLCNPPGIWDKVMSGVIRSEFVIPKFSWNLESDDSQRRRTASAPVATIEAMEALTKQVMWSTRVFLLAVVIGMGISFSQILLRKHEPSQQQHVRGKAGQQASRCGTIQLPAALL
jgi:hypothetical protein